MGKEKIYALSEVSQVVLVQYLGYENQG